MRYISVTVEVIEVVQPGLSIIVSREQKTVAIENAHRLMPHTMIQDHIEEAEELISVYEGKEE